MPPLDELRRPLALLRVALRHPRLVIGLPVLLSVLSLFSSLVGGRTYTAESLFTPETSDRSTSRLTGLAAQFGIAVGGAPLGNPVRFYAELLTSSDILTQVVLTEYNDDTPGESGRSGTLIRLYGFQRGDREKLTQRAVKRLRRDITVGTTIDAGLVRIRTTAPSNALAVAINKRLLDLVQEFNVKRRQSQASAERAFVEARLQDVRTELSRAEDSLSKFLQRNRRYEDSPQLTFERARLDRAVALRQQVFTSLAQSYEQARIDEVRNTPVITIISEPEAPSQPDGHLLLDAMVWGLVGLAIAFGGAFGWEVVRLHQLEHPEAYEDLRRQVKRAIAQVLPVRHGVSQRIEVAEPKRQTPDSHSTHGDEASSRSQQPMPNP